MTNNFFNVDTLPAPVFATLVLFAIAAIWLAIWLLGQLGLAVARAQCRREVDPERGDRDEEEEVEEEEQEQEGRIASAIEAYEPRERKHQVDELIDALNLESYVCVFGPD
ncbi:hypothetical protein E8E13_010218 [Curvularia kusanoi]|uniref:Uncharacterized protein n=1 Tax=Curvularia kusanoi TaxID=90978 RepID=A0A9P4TJ82_CURKU|nr:hypothetical protein E8E13_010218 [Curvularia kusanoi]